MRSVANEVEVVDRTAVLACLEGLTKREEKSRACAAKLFFDFGIYPSAKVVLDYTQHGSLTDINRDLHKFWRGLRDLGRGQLKIAAMPAVLLEQASELVSAIWLAAQTAAVAELEHEREEMTREVAQAQTEVVDAMRDRALAERRVLALEDELRVECEARIEAEQSVALRQQELQVVGEALGEARVELVRVQEAKQAAEDRFLGELQAEREARGRDAKRLEGDVQFCKMQIVEARGQVVELKAQHRQDLQAREGEVVAYRQRANALLAEVTALGSELVAAKVKLAGFEGGVGKSGTGKPAVVGGRLVRRR